jgi:hypothetical protein
MRTKPRFIVTVDTETFRVGGESLPFAAHHYAELPEGSFGVQRIMDVCDHYGAKATFFVDVYMHHQYGEGKVAELCQRIHRAGHDLQLHAHPSWLPRIGSELICDFPLTQQIEVLAEGKLLIRKWTGKAPVGFRAGAYGANLDTIRALKENGFRLDSSYFPLHRNCELSRQLSSRCVNRPFYIEGILEIPVTTYWLWKTHSFRKNSKIDVNACSWVELKEVVRQFAASTVEYVVLFLHSFSFIRWDRTGMNLAPKHGPLKRFEALLRMIREDLGGEFSTIDEISRMPVLQPDSAPDFMPSVRPLHLLPRALTRLFEQ